MGTNKKYGDIYIKQTNKHTKVKVGTNKNDGDKCYQTDEHTNEHTNERTKSLAFLGLMAVGLSTWRKFHFYN